ncbi:MAG: Cysteine--tRNA ligase [Chlamydiae bacterium]|nr:Cysteine--tRNA ligase [Chlamydiota bacterium]
MHKLVLYNTLTHQKQILEPTSPFLMYTCGPTVYDMAHIGNFRTFVCEDLLRRVLEFLGYKVKHVMNITDIDDKTIKGAIEKKVSLQEFTEPYTDAFFEDLTLLGCKKANAYPKATEFIPKMIQIIEKLIKTKHAYSMSDGVYFDIHSFKHYGKLSHLNLEELQAGASKRCHVDEYDRKHISDFVLWKAYDPKRDGDIFWVSPFGKGRPGWHLECSCMAMDLLGETIDLHAGGVDNIFPHHENEIAQSESLSKKPFVKHWFHVEHLLVNNKKMAKSLGNFYTLKDLIKKGYTGTCVRYLLLSAHYKTQLNFTLEALDSAKQACDRLNTLYHRLHTVKNEGSYDAKDLIESTLFEFTEALIDDLNISKALSHLFDFVRAVNALIDENQMSTNLAKECIATLEKLNEPLNIIEIKKASIPKDIVLLAKKRQQAREQKDFELADLVRKEVEEKGYLIKDTPKGFEIKKT